MASFEKFHPVLTAHYTMDWLTQTPVKQVDALFSQPIFTTVSAERLPNQILDTVKGINHIMQRVMNGTELTWGIVDSNHQAFKGIVTISGFKSTSQIGNLDFTFLRKDVAGLSEVLKRTVEFANDHFNFTQLIVTLDEPLPELSKILTANQFKTTDQRQFKLALTTFK